MGCLFLKARVSTNPIWNSEEGKVVSSLQALLLEHVTPGVAFGCLADIKLSARI